MLFARRAGYCAAALFTALVASAIAQEAARLGIFTHHQDVGVILHPGSAKYDPATQTYTITGSGDNMWFGKDQFHFVWKKVSGDFALSADIHFLGTTGNEHRKAVLMVRQSLDTGSLAVDAAFHGNGLTSLQFRDTLGGDTHEIESAATAPQRLRIEKRGDRFYLFISAADGKLEPAGASIRVPMTGGLYVGLGVSAHNKDVSETAVFSHVTLEPLAPGTGTPTPTLWSVLETVNVASTDRRVGYRAAAHFEAPNWSRDGSFLLINRTEGHGPTATGRIVRLSWTQANLAATDPKVVDTTPQTHVNNDHGLSPEGGELAISDSPDADHMSRIYIVPVTGGTPRQVTPTGPSYWHGWSPDGKMLAFTGMRNGDFDIYTIPAAGGAETRLTTAKGLDDGPEYSEDGQYIYFNSERSGHVQIWRMHTDGSGQEQVLTDEDNDWFPHISPNGKLMVYVVYDRSVTGHPPGLDVEIRMLSLADHTVKIIAKLFGGQGTMNVPSWSPDSMRIAFVSYELLPADSATAGGNVSP
jgi:TolB protein